MLVGLNFFPYEYHVLELIFFVNISPNPNDFFLLCAIFKKWQFNLPFAFLCENERQSIFPVSFYSYHVHNNFALISIIIIIILL